MNTTERSVNLTDPREGMAQPWCLAASTSDDTARQLINLYSRKVVHHVGDLVERQYREFRVWVAVEHQAVMASTKRSPKMTANWAFAIAHS